MAFEPRDVSTYLSDLFTTKDTVAPELDIQKGPLAAMTFMFATEGVRTEALATYLRRLYQLVDPELIDDDDIYQLGLNFGKDPNLAKPSRVTVYFYRFTRPEAGILYTIFEGTQVSTSDGRFVYAAIEETTMNGDLADTYFDADRGWYGIPVRCEAIAVGTDFDLPPETINTITTAQEQFDGCINLDYAREGTDPLDKFRFRDVIWAAQKGLDRDIVGTFQSILDDLDPTGYDDFSLVPSTDTASFARFGRVEGKLGYDIYLITDQLREGIESGVANGGETSFLLAKRPVSSVISVFVDGTTTAFSFATDTDPRIAGSPRAEDRVQLSVPLLPGQSYEIRYLYYGLVFDFDEGITERESPFGCDVLVRLASAVDVFVAGTVQAFSSANRDEVIEDIRVFTEGYLRNPEEPSTDTRTFVQSLDPSEYQRAVESTVDGVVQFRLTRFARTDSATLPIERIFFDGRTQYPVLSLNFDVT